MNNAERIARLEDAVAVLESAQAGDATTTTTTAVDTARAIGRAGVQPGEAELATAARAWTRAGSTWDSCGDRVQTTVNGLAGTTWTGKDATACQQALTTLRSELHRPAQGCQSVATALARLSAALEGPRAAVITSTAILDGLGSAAIAQDPAAAATQVRRMLGAFHEAEDACAQTARHVTDAAQSLSHSPAQVLAAGAAFTTVAGKATAGHARTSTPPRPRSSARRRPVPAIRSRRSSANPLRGRPTSPKRVVRGGKSRAVPIKNHRRVGPKAAPVPVSKRRTVVLTAMRKYTGIPYRWGGTTPGGFDCSGLVQYVFRQAGIRLPRTVAQQRRAGRVVSRAAARPGDLVCFGDHHVGIYLGGNMMFDAPRTGKTVGARRIWSTAVTFIRVIRD